MRWSRCGAAPTVRSRRWWRMCQLRPGRGNCRLPNHAGRAAAAADLTTPEHQICGLHLIANGFSFGDLAAVGPDNAFYISTQQVRLNDGSSRGAWNVVRLELVTGGGFGNEQVPEPGTLALVAVAMAGMGCVQRRRYTQAAG